MVKHFDAYVDVPWDDPAYAIDPSDSRWELSDEHPLGATEWYRSLPSDVRARIGLHSIVANMTNFGYPYLVVENGDYRGNRELYIKHLFEGQELDLVYAEKTLQHVYTMWSRPVHLETVYEGKRILLTYDGERNSKSTLEK